MDTRILEFALLELGNDLLESLLFLKIQSLIRLGAQYLLLAMRQYLFVLVLATVTDAKLLGNINLIVVRGWWVVVL